MKSEGLYVGAKVVVRDYKEIGNCYRENDEVKFGFPETMANLCGQEFTIKDFSDYDGIILYPTPRKTTGVVAYISAEMLRLADDGTEYEAPEGDIAGDIMALLN